ncbi:MAG: hypothetical protein DME18_00780, partial [Verrucomicrobia bacterium]
QIVLQMVHRVIAGAIVCLAALGAWLTRGQLRWQNPLSKISLAWFGLIMFQTILGAATIWTGKSANMATAHVACGAVSLMTGAMLILLSLRGLVPVERQARAAGEKTKPSEFAAEPAVVHDVRCRL